MKKMRRLVLGACAMLITGTSLAASEEVIFVIGHGSTSCGAWTKERKNYVVHHYHLQWVLGFISGMNWQSGDKQARFADVDAVAAYIDNYCASNPLKTIAAASRSVVQEGGGPEWRQ